ncbi:hypothetical protein [Candidatus Paracaedibacter symbiosus]|uniref:hypothetical protein n=1 Tax=Candidatus Paracaedibacter symbiosus TaxID=244582 RepID=UPI0012EC25EB|nr:hypothetical protein [Candidatus Paracaedibacter symbiosus]
MAPILHYYASLHCQDSSQQRPRVATPIFEWSLKNGQMLKLLEPMLNVCNGLEEAI